MLDPYVRTLINPSLDRIGQRLAYLKVKPNVLTLTGLSVGLLTMGAVVNHFYLLAVILVLLNRILDGLDGAVARFTQQTDFGGFLDIICDFLVYSGVVFAFGLAEPNFLPYSAFLLFSFIGPISTFLAYAIIAAKYKVNSKKRGIKSFYHLGGICEGTETATFLLLICLFPESFPWASIIFGVLCWLTTIGRIYRTFIDFEKEKIESILTQPSINNRK